MRHFLIKLKKHPFIRFLLYLKPYTGRIVVMYVCALLNVGAAVLLPLLIQRGIDEGIATGNMTNLLHTAGMLGVTVLIQFWALRFQGQLMMKTGNYVFYNLRRDLFNHLQKLSFRFYDQHKAGSLMTRVTSDIQVLEGLLMAGLDTILVDFIMIIGIITAMLFLDLRLSIVLVIILPLLSAVVFGLKPRIKKAAGNIQRKLSAVNAFLNESLSGIMVSRAFAREQQNINYFCNFNEEYFARTRTFYPLTAWFWQSVATLNTASVGLVLLGGGLLLYQESITIGIIAAFLTYVTRLFQPMQKISNMLNQLSRALASCERIFKVLDEKPDITEPAAAVTDFKLQGKVCFKGVNFAYKPGEPVLRNINFIVRTGETAALVGATGSGKSTIANLISRFYDVTSGQVLLDDQDLRRYRLKRLRSQIAVVMQEPQLFSGTVLDNICLALPQADKQAARHVCRTLGIDRMIQHFSRGYATELGERGGNISIGQKQLLAFARAMLPDPAVLILDEATAYLDSATEALVQKAMKKLLKGRTAFVIAHRLATIRNADTIMVVKEGAIAERGNHTQLTAARGLYAKMVKNS